VGPIKFIKPPYFSAEDEVQSKVHADAITRIGSASTY
jgi:hypothetical protein